MAHYLRVLTLCTVDSPSAGIRIALFGGVRIWRDGTELPAGPGQQRAVLALLALAEGRAAGRAFLIEALWPDGPPPSGWNIVQTHVKRLRATLEPDRPAHRPSALIPSAGDGYALRVAADRVDVVRFRTLAERAAEPHRRGDFATSFSLLDEALALWTAPPAPDVPQIAEHPWLRTLQGVRAAAVARFLDAAVALRRGAEVVELAEQAAQANPLDELAQARLIRVYQAAGRRADAFRHFHLTRSLLAEQLGVDPGAELAATHQALLQSEATDAAPLSAPAPAPNRVPVPMQLPPDVPDFVGRSALLAALDDFGADGSRPAVAAVTGPAGVGKTALVVRWSHRVAHLYPDGCLYIDLRGYGPQPPMEAAEAATRFLVALGISRTEAPGDLEELVARYRSALAGRRMLILLDNARSPAQARQLLPGVPGCRAVVTSRSDLAGLVARDGAKRLVVEPFSGPEATALLHRLVGPQADAEPQAALALARACDRLPLALRIAAERVASRPSAALGDLVAEFTDHQGRLDALSAGGDDATAVRAVFSWSYAALAADAARAFQLLGLHPGREFDAYAVAALTDQPVRTALRSVDELARLHLVRHVGGGRFTTHDLLRDYARELAEQQESETERAAATSRLLDELARTAAAAMDAAYPYEKNRRPRTDVLAASRRTFADAQQAETWLAAEIETLLAAVGLAVDSGLPQHVGFLSGTLHRYLHTAGRYTEMIELHALAAHLLQDLGDETAAGWALHDLGIACHRLARHAEATEHLNQALAIARKHGDRIGESGALHGLGMVGYRRGDLDVALAHFDEALAVNQAIGDRVAEGVMLGNIGLVLEWRDEKDEALSYYQRALTIQRAAGFRVGEGDALNNIAIVHRQCGRSAEAIDYLQQALGVYRAINDRGGQGAALNNLGLANISTRRWTEARGYLLAALEIHQVIGSLGPEAETENVLGLLDLTVGRPADALEHADRALALGEIMDDLGIQTNAHHSLGEARLALGDPGRALEHHLRALELARRTGSRPDERRALDGIARCGGE